MQAMKILVIGSKGFIGSCLVGYFSKRCEVWEMDVVLDYNNPHFISFEDMEIDFEERDQSAIRIFTSGHPKEIGNVKIAPIIIKDHAWISYNVSILKGVTIGEGAIVGAGSVVAKDVPAWSVVAGNPARVVKMLENF